MMLNSPLRNLLVIGALVSVVFSNNVLAVNRIPGSVVPGRIQTEVVPLPRALPATKIHYADFPLCQVNLAFKKKTYHLRRVVFPRQAMSFSSELAAVYRPYLGMRINAENVQQLAGAVAQFYRDHGYFAAQVVLPAQNYRNGVLALFLHTGSVADVQIDNKSTRIQSALQHYANQISALNPLTRSALERQILLAGNIVGSRLQAEILPEGTRPGCVKVNLIADLKRFGADLGYDNYNVRWQGPQEYAGNIAANSLLQAGDHTHVNAMLSVDPKELSFYAIEHNMPIGYGGTRLDLWANMANNEPGFTLEPFDQKGKAFSGGFLLNHPVLLTQAQKLWFGFGFRFIDEDIKKHHRYILKDSDRVAVAAMNYEFFDAWQGLTRAQLTVNKGLNILGASEKHCRWFFPNRGKLDFTKINAELTHVRPLFNHFSLMLGGQGQYAFNPLLVSELMGIGGRYWGRAYDWSEIMGDSGLVGTIELRYDTKPGAPENKNAQYFLAYDLGGVWLRHAPFGVNRQSLSSLQAGLRLDFTRYITGDFVVAKPLTRDVLARKLAGHSGDKVRAFFRVAVHI